MEMNSLIWKATVRRKRLAILVLNRSANDLNLGARYFFGTKRPLLETADCLMVKLDPVVSDLCY